MCPIIDPSTLLPGCSRLRISQMISEPDEERRRRRCSQPCNDPYHWQQHHHAEARICTTVSMVTQPADIDLARVATLPAASVSEMGALWDNVSYQWSVLTAQIARGTHNFWD